MISYNQVLSCGPWMPGSRAAAKYFKSLGTHFSVKNLINRILPLILAMTLPVMPLLRSLLPAASQGLAPSAWSIILKLGMGTAALLGSYDAVSGATIKGGVSNEILPPVNGGFTISLTNGLFYKVKLATTPDAAGSWTTNNVVNTTTTAFTLFPGFSLTNAAGYLGGTPVATGTAQTYVVPIYAWGTGTTAADSTPTNFTFIVYPASPQILWSAADSASDQNWSDGLNWQAPGTSSAPVSSQAVLFYNLGAVSPVGTVDNIVNSSATIQSLQYANTNNFHTTLINPGLTLTVTNPAAAALVFVGTGTDNGASQILGATITGAGGQFVVASTNSGSQMIVQQGSVSAGTHNATLNLAGLGTFKLTAGHLLVGAAVANAVNASNYCSGTLVLARTNVIRLNGTVAPALDLGDAYNNGATNLLQLGLTNSLWIDTITVAYSKATATLQFNSVLAGMNPALSLAGNSSARVATLAIGDFSAETVSTGITAGTMDLSLGTVNALVNACYVGRGQPGTGTGIAMGTLTIGAGVFNVNTLNVADLTATTAAATVTGSVNVIAGGTLVVNNNLNLGINPGATVVATATLNITNGNVFANTISVLNSGRVGSTINLVGGSLVISNTAGSHSAPLNILNLGGGTLHLNLNGGTSVTNVIATTVTTSAATTVTLDSVSGVTLSTAYPLISYNGSDPYARLSLGTLPAGYTGNLVDDAADKLISVKFNPIPPALTSLTTTVGSLVFSGTGSANAGFSIRSTNNLAIPLASWPVIGTGTINGAGLFNYTQPVNPVAPAIFFLFSSP